MTEDQSKLTHLAEKISNCRICDVQNISVTHSIPMNRGRGRIGMVVGIQPGKVDVKNAEAFSGLAGRRLMQWLSDAGVGEDRAELFENFYFTSLAKCASAPNDLTKLISNCRSFLITQITLVQPKIFITLGSEPFKHLFDAASFDDWVGRALTEQEIRPTLLPLFPASTRIFALPHPSPVSRWTNSDENRARLTRALESIGQHVRGAV